MSLGIAAANRLQFRVATERGARIDAARYSDHRSFVFDNRCRECGQHRGAAVHRRHMQGRTA